MADQSLRFRVLADAASYDAAMAKAGSSTTALADAIDKAAGEADDLARSTLAARAATLEAAKAAQTAASAQDKSAAAAKRLAAAQLDAAKANAAAADAAKKLERGEIGAAEAQRLSAVAARRDRDEQVAAARADVAAANAATKLEHASLKAAAAQLAHGKASRAGSKDAESGASGLNRAFQKLVSGALAEGEQAGELFGQGLSGAVKTITALPPEISVPIIIGGAVLAAAASAEIGAAVGGAVLGGIGAAGIGAALAAQMHDAHVTAALAALKSDTKTVFSGATAGFVQPMVRAIGAVDAMVERIGPGLKGAFDSLTGPFETLVAGGTTMVENIMPGLEAAMRAAGPILDGIAHQLPGLGSDVSDFLEYLTTDTQGASEAINGLILLFRIGFSAIGPIIAAAEVGVDKFFQAINLVYLALSKIPGSAGPLAGLRAVLESIEGNSGKASKGVSAFGSSSAAAAAAAKTLASDTESVNNAFDKLLGNAVGAEQAALKFRDALAGLTKSVKDNGTSISANTAAGRSNRESILDIISAAKDARDASIAQAAGTSRAAQATLDANAKFRGNISALIGMASQLGISTGAMKRLLVQLGLLPNETSTDIRVPGAKDSQLEIDILKKKEEALRDRYLKIKASAPQGEVDALKAKINALHDKVVTLTTRQIVETVYSSVISGKYDYYGHANHATGAVVDYYADGGMREPDHVAQLAPAGQMRTFAEPETGGEAYIPLSPDKRGRSLSIYAETGRRLGVPGAGAAPIIAPVVTPQAHRTINVYPQRADWSLRDLYQMEDAQNVRERLGRL